MRRVPDVIPRYLEKLDDAVHVSEHELGDVDCELTVDFRPLVACLSRGEAELLLAFIEVNILKLLLCFICYIYFFIYKFMYRLVIKKY